MAIRAYKPTTPGRRNMTSGDTATITKKKPEKSLLVAKKAGSGRNNQGKITIRHRGGGVKRYYRLVDFRLVAGFAGVVSAIEYDPNRSARIALVELNGGGKAYILAGSDMRVGQKIESGPEAEIRRGNRLPLAGIPVGTQIYNIELVLGKGGQIARSAGAEGSAGSQRG